MPRDKARVADLVTRAGQRVYRDVLRSLPDTSARIFAWRPITVLTSMWLSAEGVPFAHLPFWVAPPEAATDDAEFLCDVTYSTINGFCFIRLLDDVADADRPDEVRKLLPACGVFHNRFQAAYVKYFPYGHKFWSLFDAAWNAQAEYSIIDAHLADIGSSEFTSVSARKTSAGIIPVVASALRYGVPEAIEPWSEFVREVGALQQLTNDYLGCERDLKFGVNTYVLSEYRRGRSEPETLRAWLARQGHAWACAELEDCTSRVGSVAKELGSLEALEWADQRAAALRKRLAEAGAKLNERG
jgi:hypothetical protein